MTASLRASRALQRLAQSPSRLSLTSSTSSPKTSLPTGPCLLCQLQQQLQHRRLPHTTVPHLQQQQRTFTSTIRLRNPPSPSSTSTPTPEPKETIPNPPNTTTHYTIFPTTFPSSSTPFTVNTANLKREFLQLQNTLHPDKYPPGPLKQHAETLSARINEAYRTLSNPLLRAQYILHQYHGIDVTAEDGSGAGSKPLDPELLMEVIDVQEEIEELSEGGGEEAEKRIEELRGENAERVQGCVGGLERAFGEGDVEAARELTVRLKFWVSVGEGLREWEPGMGGIRLIH
ncbi:hypothetical protein BJY04DRAFT_22854 [Aspergillus karnatakaensis]|uniref:J-type chaperone JAC1 n=1 Tax=Aspergillus karnatakaensis TaxID=1810916 RepID=UPI003CCD7A62